MYDIGVYSYLRALFFRNSEEFGQVSVDSERAFSASLLSKLLRLKQCALPYYHRLPVDDAPGDLDEKR